MTLRPVCNLFSLPPHPSIQIARCIIFPSQHYQEQAGVPSPCHHLDLPFQSPRHSQNLHHRHYWSSHVGFWWLFMMGSMKIGLISRENPLI
jgi:hypothetical protein